MSDVDCVGCPGFVDLQVNGYRGVDFSSTSLTAEGIRRVCEELRAVGTAGFLATLVTSPVEVYRRNLPLIAAAVKSGGVCQNLLGIHLEGPFISGRAGYVGTHDPGFVLRPDVRLWERMWGWSGGTIRLLTVAAEVEGADRVAACARGMGVTVSIGHSAYGEDDLGRLIRAGATALTHLGNAVPNELPRHVNQIWAGLASDGLGVMFIADGHHLPDAVIRVFLAVKGVKGLVVVSDVSPMGGLEPGAYEFCGSSVVLEPGGVIRNIGRGCFAGSAMTLLPAMNRLAGMGILSRDDLIRLGYENPLEMIGLDWRVVGLEGCLFFDEGSRRFSTRG